MPPTHTFFCDTPHFKRFIERLEEDTTLKQAIIRVWKTTTHRDNHVDPKLYKLLDSPLVAYVNENVPPDTTCDQLTQHLNQVEQTLDSLQHQLQHSIDLQGSSFIKIRQGLNATSSLAHDIFLSLQNIQVSRTVSEKELQTVWNDVTMLEKGRSNLRGTIVLLQCTEAFVSALNSLKGLCHDKRYREAIPFMKIMKSLVKSLECYQHCESVQKLLSHYMTFENTLLSQFTTLFESLHDSPHTSETCALSDICELIDCSSSGTMRNDLLQHFIEVYLEESDKRFPLQKSLMNPEAAFKSLERRFVYFKKILRQFTSVLDPHFPLRWKVALLLSRRYCKILSYQFTEMLKSQTLDSDTLVNALRQSKQFEMFLNNEWNHHIALRKETETRATVNGKGSELPQSSDASTNSPFDDDRVMKEIPYLDSLRHHLSLDNEESHHSASDELQGQETFSGLVSSCFHPFLGPWLVEQKVQLKDVAEEALRTDYVLYRSCEKEEHSRGARDETKMFYASCLKILSALKHVFQTCSFVSPDPDVHDIVDVFRHTLSFYLSQLPTHDSGLVKCEKKEVPVALLGTIEILEETLSHVCLALRREQTHQTSSNVLSDQLQSLVELKIQALSQLCTVAESTFLPHLEKLTHADWTSTTLVLHESDWVKDILEELKDYTHWLHQNLSSTLLRLFFHQFLEYFLAKFAQNLVACEKISEFGAQQLLFDTEAMKNFFYSQVSCFSTHDSFLYTKSIEREFGYIENPLRILALSPTVRQDAVDQYMKNNQSQVAQDYLHKILKLRVV